MEEIPLSGGRVTAGVVRAGETVRRPQCANSPLVHRVLLFGEAAGLPVPRFLGTDEKGREILSLLPGRVPDNLGWFSAEQIAAAAGIIRTLHDGFAGFPGCGPGRTLCHNDLSPCNFLFVDGMPRFVIDWDACAPGDPLDDLAYALWMWLDIGSEDLPPAQTVRRMREMAAAYRLNPSLFASLPARMEAQMRRVEQSIFPTPAQTAATSCWAARCREWLRGRIAPLIRNGN